MHPNRTEEIRPLAGLMRRLKLFRMIIALVVLLPAFVRAETLGADDAKSSASSVTTPSSDSALAPTETAPVKKRSRVKKAGTKGSHIVGIWGDAHGNVLDADLAFQQMKKEGVTSSLTLGDITHHGPEALDTILRLHWRETGVRAKNTFGIPGNREIRNGMSYSDAIGIMRKYMNLISMSDVAYGEAAIGDPKTFQLRFGMRHFLAFKPEPATSRILFKPPPIGGKGLISSIRSLGGRIVFGPKWHMTNYRVWEIIKNHPTTRNQMRLNQRPETGRYSILVVGHTHEQYWFYDYASDTFVINPGALANGRGNIPLLDENDFATQGKGFAIARFTEAAKGRDLQIEFRDAQQPDVILEILKPEEVRRQVRDGMAKDPNYTRLNPPCRKIIKSFRATTTPPSIP